MSYGVRQANHHPKHHFHQPALPYCRPAFVISVCCSTPTCLSRFTSTSLLLAATVLGAVSRVVDVHSVVVHQLLWLKVSLSRGWSWTIATVFSLAATSNSLTNFNAYWSLNCAARVIFGGDRREHVTPLLRDKLHWLRARERITFKLCLLVYKARNGMAPNYIHDSCVPVSTLSTRSALRSAARGDLVVPRTRRRLGNRAFSVAGPAAWNSLQPDIRTASTLCTFKNMLKTHLFLHSFQLST